MIVHRRRLGGGIVNKLINSLPFELHLPGGYQYCGPGTRLKERLTRGDPGINPLDVACKEHDIAYSRNRDDIAARNEADRVLANKAWNRVLAKDSTFSEKAAAYAVTSAMKIKNTFGMGLKRKRGVVVKKKSVGRKRTVCRKKKSGGRLKRNKRKIVSQKKKKEPSITLKKIVSAASKAATIPTNRSITVIRSALKAAKEAVKKAGGLSASGALAGGAAGIAKAVNDAKAARKQLEESRRHNQTMEAIAMGTSSILEAYYFPPIELSPNKEYVLGLVELLTFNSIPNIDPPNNKFYVGEKEFVLPEGSYEIEEIENFLQSTLAEEGIQITLKPNNSTLRSIIKCSHTIDFRKEDSIGQLLGFGRRELAPNISHDVMKNWLSLNPSQSLISENAGWCGNNDTKNLVNNGGYFDITIPLSMLLGFAEDYRKIVVNMKHELIITRSRTDMNAVIVEPTENDPATYEDFKITLTKIEWLMPYVVVADRQKIKLLNYIAFQTKRKDEKSVNASQFDHCNISNVKLFLNSQYYPYGNLNLNINQNQYAMLYDMFANFQNAYYSKDAEPVLNKKDFIEKVPLIVIDCSKQNESLKNAPVDVRLEFEARENFPENTAAYCLILHDRIVQYNPSFILRMAFVADLQGFKQSGGDFVLKELAIIPLEYDAEPLVRLFEPPFSWIRLTEKYRKENSWRERNLHGISWSSGDWPYMKVGEIIKATLQGAKKVFVSGITHKEWLQRFRLPVRDIDELGYGTAKKAKLVTVCPHHSKSFKPQCALHNAKLMKQFYLDNVYMDWQPISK
ncbi:hypothetical protein KM043_000036 [Ampulex compressa]|nr:hypothetical protein KM043_000036 [Ampulex compressa]